MIVRVLLFARAREIAGTGEIALELTQGAMLGEVRQRLVELYPALANVVQHAALAVNHEFAGEDLRLEPGAEVALLPPVSGG
jgi:molybdopterin converting factor subunit 1